MAAETHTQREAAADKAAATRKRNAAKRSSTETRTSARQTRSAAQSTARAAGTTATEATRTARRRANAAGSSFEAIVREAERRLVLIPVGAALETRDAAIKTVRTYMDPTAAQQELHRFEVRGERALRRR